MEGTTVQCFLHMYSNCFGHRVSIMQIFNYIMKKGDGLFINLYACNLLLLEWLQQTRISLSLFDVQGLGYLKESVCKCNCFDVI